MKHSEVHAQLGDYLEGDLPISRRALVDAHIDDCPGCAAHLRQLRAAVDVLRSLPDPEPPPGLAGAVLARLAAGEGQPSGWTTFLERIPWRIRTRLATPMIALASAAVIFLWLRPGGDRPVLPVPAVVRPTLAEDIKSNGLAGAQSAPETDAAPAGPAVSPLALAEALRNPAALVKATEELTEAQKQVGLSALAQEARSKEQLEPLVQALRDLPDERGALLADVLMSPEPGSPSH